MKLLFFVFILSTHLFSVNACPQDLNPDFNCDYPVGISDEKCSNDTLHSHNCSTSNLIGINTNFHNSLTNIFSKSGNGNFFTFNCFFIKINLHKS